MSHGPTETIDDHSRGGAEPRLERHASLVLSLDCDRPLQGGARFGLRDAAEIVIGRGAERRLLGARERGTLRMTLQLPSPTLSTTHARFVRAGEQWAVEDARSRNGTFVNGERVERRVLEEGDVVEVGRTFFTLQQCVTAGAAPADVDAKDLAREPVGFRTLLPTLADKLADLKRISASTVPVLILGESGTGKEVVARAVHALSGRKGPFVAVNCGALPSTLVEAQLFGHVKGAFSGATRDEPGFARSAEKGTFMLDEIGELPKGSQTALLRVLQEGEVVPVGSTRPVRIDTRIVAATNRAIGNGDPSFRSDLYARLAGFTFASPPLRKRKEDLGLLIADIFRARLGEERAARVKLAPELALALFAYDWPLNIRELEQALCAAAVLAEDGVLRPSHLPPAISGACAPLGQGGAAALSAEEHRLRDAVVARMNEHRGNIAAVSRDMGKAPAQVRRWLKRFGIDPHPFRA